MRINFKLTVAFVIVALFPLLFLSSLTYKHARQTLSEEASNHLRSVAHIQKNRLDHIVQQNMERLALVSNLTQMRASLAHFYSQPSPDVRRQVNHALRDAQASIPSFKEIFVLNPWGTAVAATHENVIGKDFSQQEFFLVGRRRRTVDVFYVQKGGQLQNYLSGPLYLSGRFLGVVVILAEPVNIATAIQDYSGLGDTGETVLGRLDAKGNFQHLVPVRFDASWKDKGLGVLSTALFTGGDKTPRLVSGALDYRGRRVLAAIEFLSEANLILIAKIDEQEAFAPAVHLRNLFITTSLVVIFLVGLVSALFAQSITKPILSMANVATHISLGDYSERVSTRSQDEIGKLANAFNRMAENLIQANAQLEDKVRERTEDLTQSHEELKRSSERLNMALKVSRMGTWSLLLKNKKILMDDFTREIFGFPPGTLEISYQEFFDKVHPLDREGVQKAVNFPAQQQELDFEYRINTPDGVRYVESKGRVFRSRDGSAHYVTGVCMDISLRKQAEELVQAERRRYEKILHDKNEELARSNQDLEQFAYAASHDLQEPLRMVSGYTTLLAKRYKGKLDSEADNFIDFAVDGVTRMRRLISDLLEYSRVSSRGKEFSPIDGHAVMDRALGNLKARIDETGAVIQWDPLPLVFGDEGQLAQLFQNLIGNALKFRGKEPPKIHVGATERDNDWLFFVKDNGIGIEPAYFDRIFVVFQRLHSQAEYPGTGIGLSICKKIVQRHGGIIWVESSPGAGSTFYFTFPKVRSPKLV